jgi:hypothetical protein
MHALCVQPAAARDARQRADDADETAPAQSEQQFHRGVEITAPIGEEQSWCCGSIE